MLQTNNIRSSWDAVWMAPEEIAKEGIMISPHLLDDHYTVTLEVYWCKLYSCNAIASVALLLTASRGSRVAMAAVVTVAARF